MSSRLVIEKIASEQTLRGGATTSDLALVEQFGSESRRCEALAWRAIVRRELGADVNISYDEWGAPKVDIPNIYISVSHSRDCVAVLFADRACAVDVESEERNFCGVANRYLSEEEQRIAEQHSLHAEIWCAKEALYKYHRRGGLDLVRDITIDSYDASRGVLVCTILGGAAIEVSVSRREGLVIAVID